MTAIDDTLPAYVVISETNPSAPTPLRTPAAAFTFPLSTHDRALIATLISKYEQEENCAGLAAPQIGIAKKAMVFAVPGDPLLKKWRPDLTQAMPQTVWLNPAYTPIGEAKTADYEGCFSVPNIAGQVERYKTIHYRAFDVEGNLLEGTAQGYLARVIQHETDHLNGILFIDVAIKDSIMPVEEYRRRRAAAMAAKEIE